MRVLTLLAAIGASLSLSSTLATPSQAVPAPGERISVQVEGAGPDVILIPGLASSREVWAGLATTLRQQYRLHLVQVAGFAGSPAVPSVDVAWPLPLLRLLQIISAASTLRRQPSLAIRWAVKSR